MWKKHRKNWLCEWVNEARCVMNQRLAQDADPEADSKAYLVLNMILFTHTRANKISPYTAHIYT